MRALAFLILSLGSGCRAGESGDRPPAELLLGAAVNPAIPRPDVVLTDTDGRPYDFRAETDGHATLLFFGYTNCPDVCPLQMARIGAALHRVDSTVVRAVRVVFVSVDPDRDTPQRLRSWLDAFHPAIVGLRGDLDSVNAVLDGLSFAPARREAIGDSYGMSHPAAVIAYTPQGVGRYLYYPTTTTDDWVHDLPLLVRQP